LKTGSLVVVVDARGGPKLGMPLTRLVLEARDARLVLEAAEAAVEGVLERTSDALDVFFCSAGAAWLGRAKVDMDGFLRSCSADEGGRS
jgi:hypothetical protein